MPGANPEFEEMEFRISAVSGAENWAYWPLTEGAFLDESFMRSKKCNPADLQAWRESQSLNLLSNFAPTQM